MSINSVAGEYEMQGIEPRVSSERNTGELGKDEFLKLLITQLKYQDPLEPMDDKEFIAQMAQFTSLEQMRNMSNSMENMRAYSLIGKTVYADFRDDVTGEFKAVEGEVEGVRIISGDVYLTVNGEDIPADRVQEVWHYNELFAQVAQANTLEQMKYLNMSIDSMKGYSLIGKNISASVIDDETGEITPVEGIVSGVSIVSGTVYVLVDGKHVPVGNVEDVGNTGDSSEEDA